jgi:translation initiation factor 5A
MEKKLATVNSLKKGSYVIADGEASVVVDIQISKPGKHGSAKAKVTAVGLLDDKKRIFVSPAQDNIEVPIIAKNDAQILSVNGDQINVMDLQSYESFDLDVPDELKDQVAENKTAVYWQVLDKRVLKQVKNN